MKADQEKLEFDKRRKSEVEVCVIQAFRTTMLIIIKCITNKIQVIEDDKSASCVCNLFHLYRETSSTPQIVGTS